MTALAYLLFYGYVAMLIGVGIVGVFVAEGELTRVFHLALDRVSIIDRSTFLNQYRFLKSAELGAGLFCFVRRNEIFRDPQLSRVFLALVLGGVFARAWSVVRDGRPRSLFLMFMALELLTAIAVAAVTRPF